MPAQGGSVLYERPPSISSGKELAHGLVIQRRSDVLLEEQVENVKNVQDALQRVLTNLDYAKTKEEQESFRAQAEELRQRCEEMMLVLKMIQKINTELTYARVGLKKAMQTGTNITLARKRVNWLEDKMEHLLGKDKQRRPSRAHMKLSVDEEEMNLNQSEALGDYRCSGSRGISEFSSMGGPDMSVGDSSTPPSRQKDEPGQQVCHDLTMGVPATDMTLSPFKDSARTEESVPDSSVTVTGLSEAKKKWSMADAKLQPVSESQDWPSTSSSSSTSSSPSSSMSSSMSSSSSPSLSPSPVPPSLLENQMPQPQEIDKPEREDVVKRKEWSEEDEDESMLHQSTEKLDMSYGGSEPAPTFLTEVERELHLSRNGTYSHKSQTSHITIRTPAEMLEAIDQRDVTSSAEPDEAAQYWNSEHHRFEFSEYTDVLLSINPLSYHQLGLAVPGTFVEDVQRDATLPWRQQDEETSAGEVVDIHKQALDKLSLKLKKMYSRVKEASLLSVEGYKEKEFGAPSLFQNLEDSPVGDELCNGESETDLVQRESTVESSHKPAPSKTTVAPSGSKAIVSLPPLENDRIGSSFSGRLVYYPKPLPYPEKLPLTRLITSKQYPPQADLYSQSVPGKDPPAERFVNQRNLYKETKFTSSLFRSKHSKQKKVAPVQQQFEPAVPCQTSPSNKGLLSLRSTFKMAATTVKLGRDDDGKEIINSAPSISTNEGVGKWKDMKPKSGFLDHSGLKWERVKNIVHKSLESSNTEERIDAARHLGALKCGDAMVNYALRVRMQKDPEPRVVYESTKALISLGCWDEEVVEKVIHFLKIGNSDVRKDLLKAIKNGKNVQYVDKKIKNFSIMTNMISILCMNPNPDDELSFQAAMCLGKLCVVDSNAVAKLRMVMETTTNTHDRAQALNILVHQMNEHDPITVRAVMDQLRHSPVWKYRKEAARHLITIGPRHVRHNGQVEEMFELLLRRLWDEPNKEVRQEVAKALAAQELYARACEKVERCLSDSDENIRAQAVISIGTLSMKAERIIRSLLEMMELDSSDYVRLLILRTFGVMNCTDKRVMRLLRDKEKGDGPLAREAKRVLECLSGTTRNGKTNKTKNG